jgi:hypothetical protein
MIESKICDQLFFSRGIRGSLDHCVQSCSPYFSASATQEILDEFRPQMCPVVSSFSTTIKMLELFLPVILLPDLHHQGFKYVYSLVCITTYAILDYGYLSFSLSGKVYIINPLGNW